MGDKPWKRAERIALGRFTDPATGEKVGRLPSNGHAQSDGRIPALPVPQLPPISLTPMTREKITGQVAEALKQAATNTIPGNLTVVLLSVAKGELIPGKGSLRYPPRRMILMSVDDFMILSNPVQTGDLHPPIDVESKCWATLPPKLVADLDMVTANALPGSMPVAIITALANEVTFALMDFEDFAYLAGGESTRTYTTATIGA